MVDTPQIDFKALALSATSKGLFVIPLAAGTKNPPAGFDGWQNNASNDPEQIEIWDKLYPHSNCGAVTSLDTNLILDFDNAPWLLDQKCPPVPLTYAIKTGGGGYQYHFAQTDYSRVKLSNSELKNPDFERWPSEKPCVLEVLFDRKQGLVGGCVHPNGNLYEAVHDVPVCQIPDAWVDWVVKTLDSKPSAVSKRLHPLRKDSDIEKVLTNADLKFHREEKDGKIFFIYHDEMGLCLLKGERHSNDKSAFVVNTENNEFWHQCFSAGCGGPTWQNTKKALAALPNPIRFEDILERDGLHIELPTIGDEKSASIKYLWPGYLPVNKLVHFAGNSTEGKSPVTLDLIARVTNPTLGWPDGKPNLNQPGHCILMAGEDDLHDTVIPRLDLAGADRSLIHTVKATVRKDMTEAEKTVALDTDVRELVRQMKSVPNLALVAIDPITNHLGKLSMNIETEVRQALMPLSFAAVELNCCIVTVGHFNKREKGTSPKQRILGATAFHGVARFVYIFGPDPESEDKFGHIFSQDRGVGSPTLRYKTVAENRTMDDGLQCDVVKVEWLGESTATSEDAVDPISGRDKKDIKAASDCLRMFLSPGKRPAEECVEHLAQSGFVVSDGKGSPGLNTGRIRAKARVDSKKEGTKWYWFLNAPEEVQESMY